MYDYFFEVNSGFERGNLFYYRRPEVVHRGWGDSERHIHTPDIGGEAETQRGFLVRSAN